MLAKVLDADNETFVDKRYVKFSVRPFLIINHKRQDLVDAVKSDIACPRNALCNLLRILLYLYHRKWQNTLRISLHI